MATVQKLFGGIDIKIYSEKCDVVKEFRIRTLNIKRFDD